MTPLEIAYAYMDIVFSGRNFERLRPLLAEDFTFDGPMYQYGSVDQYIRALTENPPEDFAYETIRAYEDEGSACVVYVFTKPGVEAKMAQLWEMEGGKVKRTLLLFDASPLR
jgi:hypothetical protein